jgi:hypothetical protein
MHDKCTIGGYLVFPNGIDQKREREPRARRWTINQARGCDRRISDRIDLTLEAIRLYFDGIIDRKANPLPARFVGSCIRSAIRSVPLPLRSTPSPIYPQRCPTPVKCPQRRPEGTPKAVPIRTMYECARLCISRRGFVRPLQQDTRQPRR